MEFRKLVCLFKDETSQFNPFSNENIGIALISRLKYQKSSIESINHFHMLLNKSLFCILQIAFSRHSLSKVTNPSLLLFNFLRVKFTPGSCQEQDLCHRTPA